MLAKKHEAAIIFSGILQDNLDTGCARTGEVLLRERFTVSFILHFFFFYFFLSLLLGGKISAIENIREATAEEILECTRRVQQFTITLHLVKLYYVTCVEPQLRR